MSSHPSSAASVERRALSGPVLRVCRALLALAVLTAIAYDVAAGPGVSDADYFSYFTVLSNLFAVTMLLYGALPPRASALERSSCSEAQRSCTS